MMLMLFAVTAMDDDEDWRRGGFLRIGAQISWADCATYTKRQQSLLFDDLQRL